MKRWTNECEWFWYNLNIFFVVLKGILQEKVGKFVLSPVFLEIHVVIRILSDGQSRSNMDNAESRNVRKILRVSCFFFRIEKVAGKKFFGINFWTRPGKNFLKEWSNVVKRWTNECECIFIWFECIFCFFGEFYKKLWKNTFFACISWNTRSLRILSDGQSRSKMDKRRGLKSTENSACFLLFFRIEKMAGKMFFGINFERGPGKNYSKGWSNVVKRWTNELAQKLHFRIIFWPSSRFFGNFFGLFRWW